MGVVSLKMDGEINGKPYLKWMIFWGKTHYFWKHPNISKGFFSSSD